MCSSDLVAVDNFGAKTESAAVSVGYYTDPPPAPVVEIVSPSDRAMSAPPATFVFSAELLASTGDSGPVEFFVGTNSASVVDLGGSFSATMPPASVTVSNLLEGEYKLTVRYLGANGTLCPCKLITNTVRVVQLGVRLPSVTPDDRLQFEVVTAFPGKPTVIQASTNLLDWAPMSTNQPTSNTFSITESSPATNSQRFFRVFLPP